MQLCYAAVNNKKGAKAVKDIQLRQQVVSEGVTLEADILWFWPGLPDQPLLEFLIHKIVRKIKILFQQLSFQVNCYMVIIKWNRT